MRTKSNRQYYKIANPTDKNLKTGNFCLSYKDFSKFDKDFEWDWIDPETNEHYHKIIDKRYIIDNCRPCFNWEYNMYTCMNELKGMFYLISFTSLETYDKK